jgi:hypothetical protein
VTPVVEASTATPIPVPEGEGSAIARFFGSPWVWILGGLILVGVGIFVLVRQRRAS